MQQKNTPNKAKPLQGGQAETSMGTAALPPIEPMGHKGAEPSHSSQKWEKNSQKGKGQASLGSAEPADQGLQGGPSRQQSSTRQGLSAEKAQKR